MTVGERIREEREKRGWSQEDLATRAGYTSKAAVSKAELHSGDITTAKVSRFAKAFGVSFECLMGWDEESETQKKKELEMISEYLKELNSEGLEEAIKRIEELTYLPKYKKDCE